MLADAQLERLAALLPPQGVDTASWAWRNIIAQDKEHSPRGTKNSTQTLASSGSVNPLAQLVLVSATATATLETAVGADRRWHVFINTGTGTMTVACTGSETISGASTRATSTQYAAFFVFSDGTNWQSITLDVANALGILAVAHGGTGASTASGAWKNLSVNQTPLPLMKWGGMNFDGSSTYLNGNALTGIADGKKGTFFAVVRFANAASATERIFHSSSGRMQVSRTATGVIQFIAMNSALSTIMSFSSATAVAASSGTYAILASWNLANSTSGRLYVDDVSVYSETTFTDDTIDYTTTQYGVGATVNGTNFLNGDIYCLYFDATDNLGLSAESVRRRFTDANAVPIFMGKNGAQPMRGVIPTLFLAYDDYRNWPSNKGTAAGTFTVNGTAATPATVKVGQFSHRPIIVENEQVLDVDQLIATGKNAHSVGPITILAGVTVTTQAGSTWQVT